MFRRAATHRKLPTAQNHWEGQLCQGQTGTAHIDWQRGEFKGTRKEESVYCKLSMTVLELSVSKVLHVGTDEAKERVDR